MNAKIDDASMLTIFSDTVFAQAVLETYNIQKEPTNALAEDFARGRVGARLHPLDQAAMQLHPGRIFVERELVAWEDEQEEHGDGAAGAAGCAAAAPVYRYGRVVSQAFGDAVGLGLGLSSVTLQVSEGGGGDPHRQQRTVLSSDVWSFKASRTQQTKASPKASKLLPHVPEPVSYTHLTLPTIYSV